jgi:2-oxoacid dehydrogenases acyltransferase (catalytic domain)
LRHLGHAPWDFRPYLPPFGCPRLTAESGSRSAPEVGYGLGADSQDRGPVGVGKVVSRPWAVDGLLGVRSVTTLTLSADHRATDGNTGARFLDAIDQVLSQPDTL